MPPPPPQATPTIVPRPTSPPSYRRKPLRICCVQFDPKLKDVTANIAKAKAMLTKLKPGSVDLIVFPEMAFSGYVFTSPDEIRPYLEHPRTGSTALFCRELAKRVGAFVASGYPEQPEEGEDENERGWNSLLVVSPEGDVIHNYRKSFLFETDKNWARAGTGFSYIDLPEPLGRVSFAICMDINPQDFVAPWDAYELSSFAQKNDVAILVLSMNWLDPPPPVTDADRPHLDSAEDPESPNYDTLNYLAHRLMPLHDPSPVMPFQDGQPTASPANRHDGEIVPGQDGERRTDERRRGKEVVFVGCNRIGEEKGTRFVGSSSVMTLSTEPSKVEVIDVLGRQEEMVLFVTCP